MKGELLMRKTSHIVWGLSSITSDKVELLKKSGEKEIYVLDYNQASKVQERNGIVYMSLEGASLFFKNADDIMYHHYIPEGFKRNRRRGK